MPKPNDINDALVALSVLLVFVIAYFSAVYPQTQLNPLAPKIVGGVEVVPSLSEKNAEKKRLSWYRKLLWGIAILDAFIFLLISKDSFEVIKVPSSYWPWSHTFVMAYGALMLVALFVILFLVVLGWNICKIGKKKKAIAP